MSGARAELEPIERASRDEIEAFPMVRYRTRDLTALLPPTSRSMRRIARITRSVGCDGGGHSRC